MSAPAPVGLKTIFKEMMGTISGKLGVAIIIFLIILSMAVPVYTSPGTIKKWNNPKAWVDYPKCAAPGWTDLFTKKTYCRNMVFNPQDFYKYSESIGGIYRVIYLIGVIEYNYDSFPNIMDGFKISLITNSSENLLVNITLMRPDDLSATLWSDSIYVTGQTLPIVTELSAMDHDIKKGTCTFIRRVTGENIDWKGVIPHIALFAKVDPNMNDPCKAEVLKGKYKLLIWAITYDPDADLDAKFIVYGSVYGLAGTDARGRDITIGILWGAPIALAFGLMASVILGFLHAIFGVMAGWFGGKIDEVIQRATEMLMIIPTMPILILISFLFRVNVWTLIAILVALNPLGGSTLTIRSMVLQIKEEQHILAALAYGSSNYRIMFKHIFPRILPYMVVGIVMSVPGYIFLEASLSILGLGEPTLPTWGKILSDAFNHRALYLGWWWWILIPAILIIITAFAFGLLGYSLDKIVNPRLREI